MVPRTAHTRKKGICHLKALSALLALCLWLLMTGFFSLLPSITRFNREFRLCNTPIAELHCHWKDNTAERMKEHGMVNELGEPVGCGCGEGFLGNFECPGFFGYTLSGFIDSAAGTGAAAAAVFWPIVVLIVYGGVYAKHHPVNSAGRAMHVANLFSLFIFFISFYAFLMAPLCAFPNAHAVAVATYIFAIFIHFLIMSRMYFAARQKGRGSFILVSAVIALLAALGFVLCGLQYQATMDPNIVYLPWFFEVVGISIALGITPCIMIKDWWDGVPFLLTREVVDDNAEGGDSGETQGLSAMTPVEVELEPRTQLP